MKTIIITKRCDDFKARIEGTAAWGNGSTPQSALGSLLMFHTEEFSGDAFRIAYKNEDGTLTVKARDLAKGDMVALAGDKLFCTNLFRVEFVSALCHRRSVYGERINNRYSDHFYAQELDDIRILPKEDSGTQVA